MKDYTKILLILLLPLLAAVGYALYGERCVLQFDKVDLQEGLHLRAASEPWSQGQKMQDKAPSDSKLVLKGGEKAEAQKGRTPSAAGPAPLDTARQRILFFGDSMVEGLGPRMAEYAAANGHELTYVCWYSSNTALWAGDTLRHFLREVRPTHVVVTIGGNEQQARDLPQREEYVRAILRILGDIPYTWVCTPAWSTDAPFNAIPERLCGPHRFYDSRRLTLQRGSDHHHPTFSAARVWMDSLALWMQSPQSAHPIRMKVPPPGTPRHCRPVYLSSRQTSFATRR